MSERDLTVVNTSDADMALGSVELAGGRWVHGFVGDAEATIDARDISHFGGWRRYVA